MVLDILQANAGQKIWWVGATDLGEEGDWFWLRSKERVGEYIWFGPNPGYKTASNCLTLNYAAGYKGLDQGCLIIFTSSSAFTTESLQSQKLFKR